MDDDRQDVRLVQPPPRKRSLILRILKALPLRPRLRRLTREKEQYAERLADLRREAGRYRREHEQRTLMLRDALEATRNERNEALGHIKNLSADLEISYAEIKRLKEQLAGSTGLTAGSELTLLPYCDVDFRGPVRSLGLNCELDGQTVVIAAAANDRGTLWRLVEILRLRNLATESTEGAEKQPSTDAPTASERRAVEEEGN